MARKKNRSRKNAVKKADAELNVEERVPNQAPILYGPGLSKKRLRECGFHSAVTDKNIVELVKSWYLIAHRYATRPTRDEYFRDPTTFDHGLYSSSRHFIMYDPSPSKKKSAVSRLFVGNCPYGLKIINEISADGFKTLQDFVTALPGSWDSLRSAAAVYDFAAQTFQGTPGGNVFLALNAEFTYSHTKNHPLAKKNHDEARWKVLCRLGEIKQLCHQKRSYGDSDLLSMVKLLPRMNLDRMMREAELPPNHVIKSFNCGDCEGLFEMLTRINERKNTMWVIHFQKIPFLDRRILAIILRSCPMIKMVGIYDCPLLHFGDVICILDLISDINRTRRNNGQPEITALDYYPRYNAGVPYASSSSITYGLLWGPEKRETVQRGFFRIILEAVMKARRMKVRLLFEESKAFRTFLARQPFNPLAVPSFLDGLHRYLDLKGLGHANDDIPVKKSLFDLLGAVRLGLQDVGQDGLDWHSQIKNTMLVFCSSCGYEMLQDFFSITARHARPHRRTCSGCGLRQLLDGEIDHQKYDKIAILNRLFRSRGWDRTAFNPDAMLDRNGKDLFQMKTRQSLRPHPPHPQVDALGNIVQPPFSHALVRDNKVHCDSVQSLPSLERLIGPELTAIRNMVIDLAINADVRRTASHILYKLCPRKSKGILVHPGTRQFQGPIDHFDETQLWINAPEPVAPGFLQEPELSVGGEREGFW